MKIVNINHGVWVTLTGGLFLAACSFNPQPTQAVELKVPVAVSCVSGEVKEPAWNMSNVQANAKPPEKLKAALADLELSRGYIDELKAELAGCS